MEERQSVTLPSVGGGALIKYNTQASAGQKFRFGGKGSITPLTYLYYPKPKSDTAKGELSKINLIVTQYDLEWTRAKKPEARQLVWTYSQ